MSTASFALLWVVWATTRFPGSTLRRIVGLGVIGMLERRAASPMIRTRAANKGMKLTICD